MRFGRITQKKKSISVKPSIIRTLYAFVSLKVTLFLRVHTSNIQRKTVQGKNGTKPLGGTSARLQRKGGGRGERLTDFTVPF